MKIPKKADIGDCNTWPGIILLSIQAMFSALYLLQRIRVAVDATLRDEQAIAFAEDDLA